MLCENMLAASLGSKNQKTNSTDNVNLVGSKMKNTALQ